MKRHWKDLKKTAKEFKRSNKETCLVIMCMKKPNKTRPELQIKCFGSTKMSVFMENEEVQRMFHEACNKSSEVEKLKAPTSATTTTSHTSSTLTTSPTSTSETMFPTTTSSISTSSSPASTSTQSTGTTTQETSSSAATTTTIGITTTAAPTTLSESTTSEITTPTIASTSETSTTSVPATSSVISCTASSTTSIPSQTTTSSSATTTLSTQETSNTTTTTDKLPTVQEKHGDVKYVLNKIRLHPSSSKDKYWSDGDHTDKKRKNVESQYQKSETVPPRSLHETNRSDEVPTASRNSRLGENKEEPWADEISSMCTSTQETSSSAATTTTIGNTTTGAPTTLSESTASETTTPTITYTTSTTSVPTTSSVMSSTPQTTSTSATSTASSTTSITSTTTSSSGTTSSTQETPTTTTTTDGGMARKIHGEPRTDSKPATSWLEWNNKKKLRFIQDTIDCKGGVDVPGLENHGAKTVKVNWTRRISEKIWKAMQGPQVRVYDGSSVKHLLRFIRNAYTHYHDLTEDVKTALGKPRSKILDYFTHRFPMLLDHTYSVMEQFKEEDDFRSYY